MSSPLTLSVLDGRFGVCRLTSDASFPDWAHGGAFVSATRTPDELSVICAEEAIPVTVTHEKGWRALRVHGPLDFSEVGVMAAISSALASAGVSLLAVATYDTDYVLVRDDDLDRASRSLASAGHRVLPSG